MVPTTNAALCMGSRVCMFRQVGLDFHEGPSRESGLRSRAAMFSIPGLTSETRGRGHSVGGMLLPAMLLFPGMLP